MTLEAHQAYLNGAIESAMYKLTLTEKSAFFLNNKAFTFGKLCVESGNYAGAISTADKMLQPGYDPVVEGLVYPLALYLKSRAFEIQGDLGKAAVLYKQFLTVWEDADEDNILLRDAQQHY